MTKISERSMVQKIIQDDELQVGLRKYTFAPWHLTITALSVYQ